MRNFNYNCYYIFFTSGHGWKRHLLKYGFSHLFLVTGDEHNFIEIDPGTALLNITILPLLNTDDPMQRYMRVFDHLKKPYRILRVELDDKRSKKHKYYIPSCVNLVLYCMALKVWCITPFGLYRKLLNLDARGRAKHGIKAVKIIK
jgi:hypothetical protein